MANLPPWDDGFTFTQDSTGHPWVAVTAEGTGGKLYFPAKDHPSDEPDEGVDMTITVPKGLVVAGPYTRTANTEDVERLFCDASGMNLRPLFRLYLYTTEKLEIEVRQPGATAYRIKLLNIEMSLPIEITTDKGTSRELVDNKKGVAVMSTTMPFIDTRGFYLKKVIYE